MLFSEEDSTLGEEEEEEKERLRDEQEEEHTPRLLGDRLLQTWQKVWNKALCVGPIIFTPHSLFPSLLLKTAGFFSSSLT